jgi:hypothetical protein
MTPIEVLATMANNYAYELRMRGCHDAADRAIRDASAALQAIEQQAQKQPRRKPTPTPPPTDPTP